MRMLRSQLPNPKPSFRPHCLSEGWHLLTSTWYWKSLRALAHLGAIIGLSRRSSHQQEHFLASRSMAARVSAEGLMPSFARRRSTFESRKKGSANLRSGYLMVSGCHSCCFCPFLLQALQECCPCFTSTTLSTVFRQFARRHARTIC